jgi:hypothetical protein
MTPLVVVVAALVLYLGYSAAQYARLRAFKGPTAAALSRLWLLNCVQSGKMHYILHDVSKKYGMYFSGNKDPAKQVRVGSDVMDL